MTQKDKELLLKDLCARLPYKSLGVSSSTIINRCNGKYGEYNGMKFYYK